MMTYTVEVLKKPLRETPLSVIQLTFNVIGKTLVDDKLPYIKQISTN